jgi:NADH dehydrogenase
VVILGGGFAGLAAARQLRAGRHRVTLVDRRPSFEFLPNVHELLSGVKSPELLRLPLARSARRLGHRFLRDTVTGIDPRGRRVAVRKRGAIPYDALVVALGGVNASHGVGGVAEHALPFTSVDACARIGRELARLARRRAPGRVVIVGGGLEGVEALGEILRRHRRSGRLRVTVVEARERLLPEAPAALHRHVVSLASPFGVAFEMRAPVAHLEAGAVILADGRRLASDCTIWTGGPAPPPLLAQAGLAPPGAWAPVRATLQSLEHPEVFVAGDACALPEPLSKQGYHALDMGVRAADNAARLLAGRPLRPFRPSGKPMLISFGDLSCFLVVGRRVVAGPALAAGKEAVFELVMGQLDDAPWWSRLPRALARAERAARRLLWPSVSSLEALLRQGRVSVLSSG